MVSKNFITICLTSLLTIWSSLSELPVETRANDDSGLLESIGSSNVFPSPRHYQSDEISDEVYISGSREGYINKQAKPNGDVLESIFFL